MVVVDLQPKADPHVRVGPLRLELVLLLGEREAIGMARPVELGRPAVPHEPADRRPVGDELVVVELRPAEPGPPLRARLALVVVDEVPEEASRRALLGTREQPLLERRPLRVALDELLLARAELRRIPPRQAGRADPEQPLVELVRRAAVLLVVALDLLEDRVVAGLDPLLEADDRLVAARDVSRALEAVELLDRLDRVALDRGAERLLRHAVEVDEHLGARRSSISVSRVPCCPISRVSAVRS